MSKGLSPHRNALCASLPSDLYFQEVNEIASNPIIFKSLNSSLSSSAKEGEVPDYHCDIYPQPDIVHNPYRLIKNSYPLKYYINLDHFDQFCFITRVFNNGNFCVIEIFCIII